jgi:hypothetical protein
VIIYLTDQAFVRENIAVLKRELDRREAAYQRKKLLEKKRKAA